MRVCPAMLEKRTLGPRLLRADLLGELLVAVDSKELGGPPKGIGYLPHTSAAPVDDRRVKEDEPDVLIETTCVLQRRS